MDFNLIHYAVYAWLGIGFISCLVATAVFRRSGKGKKKELYLATLGPLFGPIVLILMIIDLIKGGIYSEKRIPYCATIGKGGTAMRYIGNMQYWRDAGEWGIRVEWKRGKLVTVAILDNDDFNHIYGKPMIKITLEEYKEKNQGYLPNHLKDKTPEELLYEMDKENDEIPHLDDEW
jgi:hypothetical protein